MKRNIVTGYGRFYGSRARYFWYLYFLPGCGDRWDKTRLILCACRTVGFDRFRRLRVKNLHNFVSKNSRFHKKWSNIYFGRSQKLFLVEIEKFRFFGLKFFHTILNDNFHSKLYENEKNEIEKNDNFLTSTKIIFASFFMESWIFGLKIM